VCFWHLLRRSPSLSPSRPADPISDLTTPSQKVAAGAEGAAEATAEVEAATAAGMVVAMGVAEPAVAMVEEMAVVAMAAPAVEQVPVRREPGVQGPAVPLAAQGSAARAPVA
jgi:hypothetical protein